MKGRQPRIRTNDGEKTILLTVFMTIYLIGAVVTTIGAFAEGRWFLRDDRTPSAHPLGVAVLAGAVWPLLLLGVIEVGAVVALRKTLQEPRSGVEIYG
jgi:hypothetical protein